MNVKLLTIENNLAPKPGTGLFPSKTDSKTEGAQFALNLEDAKQHANIPIKITADNIRDSNTKDSQLVPTSEDEKTRADIFEKLKATNIKDKSQNHKKQPVSISPQNFTQLIGKRTKTENLFETDNKTKSKPKEQSTIIDSGKQQNSQPDIIHMWFAEHSIAVEQNKEGAATKTEKNSGPPVNQITANTQNDKASSVTGHAVKSAEIKLIHTFEKGQLGLKTIMPAKSMAQNGLKAVTTDTAKNILADKIQVEAENNAKKQAVPSKTITEIKSDTEKGNTKELTHSDSDNNGKNTKEAKPQAGNTNPTTVQSKTPEKQPRHGRIEPDKPTLTAETDAKANAHQNIRNLSNNNKEAIPAGNNFKESQNAQNLKITTVQVTAGQTKDQSNLSSTKSPSQGFEQMLSHNNSQTISTEPLPASAKNAATDNPTGRSPSSDVPADIGKQILESVQRSISQQETDRQITVRLNPPELGRVLIKFQQQGTEITGLMEVGKAQTRFEIEQALPQIIRNLADCGIQIRRLEVTLSNEQQPGQGTFGNQSLQSDTSQQQHSGNPATSGNDMDISEGNESMSTNNSYENISELQGVLNTEGSINLLI